MKWNSQPFFINDKNSNEKVQPNVFRIYSGRAEKCDDRSLTGLFLDFPVTRFRGEKSVVLSTLTWSGGSSLFLGLTYTVTGAMTWLASFSMMAIHLMLKRKKMVLPQQSSQALKRKAENTETDSEVTEPKMSDKPQNDWNILSRGTALTDQVQFQVDK